MISTINGEHAIFKSLQYQKDDTSFICMEAIKQQPFLLKSNEKDYIIGASSEGDSIWIWTSDLITENALDELSKYLYQTFKSNKSLEYIAKPDIATRLVTKFKKELSIAEELMEIQCLVNPKVILPKSKGVKIEKPTEQDIQDIAVCLSGFMKDCFNKEVSPALLLEQAKAKLNRPFYVIKQKGAVVATAESSIETQKYVSINRVYTKNNYRGQGFAGSLVAYISEQILVSGKLPLLFTDLSNPYSNKAYKNIGFIEKGRIDQVTLRWK